ncbi:hypothetical protein BDR03DRAFT_948005 [Suillus americanus]|nr:hypothetical protein BDR03DRAFT_948005 [Suillus americanus]
MNCSNVFAAVISAACCTVSSQSVLVFILFLLNLCATSPTLEGVDLIGVSPC